MNNGDIICSICGHTQVSSPFAQSYILSRETPDKKVCDPCGKALMRISKASTPEEANLDIEYLFA